MLRDAQRWGRGTGAALLAATEDRLAGLGFAEAVLWTFAANTRAHAFYARAGWRPYADPQHGTIRIGGVDVRDVEDTELQRHVTAVFQDVFLFDDTIAANIAIGRPDSSPDEIEAAAREAACRDFIAGFPRGYDTRVGESATGCRAGNVSGSRSPGPS